MILALLDIELKILLIRHQGKKTAISDVIWPSGGQKTVRIVCVMQSFTLPQIFVLVWLFLKKKVIFFWRIFRCKKIGRALANSALFSSRQSVYKFCLHICKILTFLSSKGLKFGDLNFEGRLCRIQA